MARGKIINQRARTFCLKSVETVRSLSDLLPDKEEQKIVFGSTKAERKRVTNYRNKRTLERKLDQTRYVETCIENGVRIQNNGILREIEKELLFNGRAGSIMKSTRPRRRLL
jgi:hypothetical protein